MTVSEALVGAAPTFGGEGAKEHRLGSRPELREVVVGGVPITALTLEQWVDLMVADCAIERERRPKAKFMTSANGHVISLYARRPAFRALLDQADGIDADGMPLVVASRLFAADPIPERIATTDLFHLAARRAQQLGLSFYFLGGHDEDNQKAVARVREQYPNLRIAGHHHGFFSPDEEPAIVEDIVTGGTDVLWVAMGVPREHQFIVRNRDKLTGVAWAKSCGGMFKFLGGRARRAPQWMQSWCLEWAHRVAREPTRLFWRYFHTNLTAIYLICRHRAETRVSVRRSGASGRGPSPDHHDRASAGPITSSARLE